MIARDGLPPAKASARLGPSSISRSDGNFARSLRIGLKQRRRHHVAVNVNDHFAFP